MTANTSNRNTGHGSEPREHLQTCVEGQRPDGTELENRRGPTDTDTTGTGLPLLGRHDSPRGKTVRELCSLEAAVGNQAYTKRPGMRRTGPSGPDRLRPQSLPLNVETR